MNFDQIKKKALNVMRDGRERTAEDVAHRVGFEHFETVKRAMTSLARGKSVKSTRITRSQEQTAIYRIVGAAK